MWELVFFGLAIGYLERQLRKVGASAPGAPLARRRMSPRLVQLEAYADRLYHEKKYLAAEKAYLSVLKLDHKHTVAYNKLGIIYSAQKNYADAIECFELAARMAPTATAYQNLGLAYYENRNYIKAIAAFEKSIMFEPSAQRYIGLGKSFEKLQNSARAMASVEQAVELDPSPKNLGVLASLYQAHGRIEQAKQVRQRLQSTVPPPVQVPPSLAPKA